MDSEDLIELYRSIPELQRRGTGLSRALAKLAAENGHVFVTNGTALLSQIKREFPEITAVPFTITNIRGKYAKFVLDNALTDEIIHTLLGEYDRVKNYKEIADRIVKENVELLREKLILDHMIKGCQVREAKLWRTNAELRTELRRYQRFRLARQFYLGLRRIKKWLLGKLMRG